MTMILIHTFSFFPHAGKEIHQPTRVYILHNKTLQVNDRNEEESTPSSTTTATTWSPLCGQPPIIGALVATMQWLDAFCFLSFRETVFRSDFEECWGGVDEPLLSQVSNIFEETA